MADKAELLVYQGRGAGPAAKFHRLNRAGLSRCTGRPCNPSTARRVENVPAASLCSTRACGIAVPEAHAPRAVPQRPEPTRED